MGKNYQELQMDVIDLQNDVVRTSTGADPFEDGYKDPNLNFVN